MDTIRILALATLSIIYSSAHALNNDEIYEKMRALDWKKVAGTYEINKTNSSVTTNSNEILVLGDEAHKYLALLEGHNSYRPDAVIVRVQGDATDSQVIYTYSEIGYVKMDDWEDHINKDELLETIRNSTNEANKIRAEGYPRLFVDKWLQEPYLDKENAIIYWAILGHNSDGYEFVNAKALKLGRDGFTEIIWLGSVDKYTGTNSSLSPTLAAYEYNDGAKYADFVEGQHKVAAVGAGALAYKLITGKNAKAVGAGIIAAILLFLKKFWFVVLIPFVYGWKKLVKKES